MLVKFIIHMCVFVCVYTYVLVVKHLLTHHCEIHTIYGQLGFQPRCV